MGVAFPKSLKKLSRKLLGFYSLSEGLPTSATLLSPPTPPKKILHGKRCTFNPEVGKGDEGNTDRSYLEQSFVTSYQE